MKEDRYRILALGGVLALLHPLSISEGSQPSPSYNLTNVIDMERPTPLNDVLDAWDPDQVLREVRGAIREQALFDLLALQAPRLDLAYTDRLVDALVLEGRRQKIDPLLLLAVIKVESAYIESAISVMGARGLMQVMPATGAEMAQRLGMPWSGPEILHDLDTNVRLGAYYLRLLLDQFQGDTSIALLAYNAGLRGVRNGSEQGREYAIKVQQTYERFCRKVGAAVQHSPLS